MSRFSKNFRDGAALMREQVPAGRESADTDLADQIALAVRESMGRFGSAAPDSGVAGSTLTGPLPHMDSAGGQWFQALFEDMVARALSQFPELQNSDFFAWAQRAGLPVPGTPPDEPAAPTEDETPDSDPAPDESPGPETPSPPETPEDGTEPAEGPENEPEDAPEDTPADQPDDTPAQPPAPSDAPADPPAEDPAPQVLSTYTSGGAADTSFNVKINFAGTWTVELQAAFIEAADFFSSIILGDLSDHQGRDDITISATLEEIDGPFGILGSAGPTVVRSSNYLPIEGQMRFDIADAEVFDGKGLWDDIVLHEMLHAMGFGTVWSFQGLVAGSVSGGDIRFIGQNANDVYARDFAALDAADGFDFGVPIEADGGAGTAGGHWDEGAFDHEIMTGYIDGSNFLSELTIASLEDMGYDTIFDNAYDPDDLVGVMGADPLVMV